MWKELLRELWEVFFSFFFFLSFKAKHDQGEECPTKNNNADDEGLVVTKVNVSTTCPITQSTFKEPVKNSMCGHSYEKIAIMQYLKRNKNSGKLFLLFVFVFCFLFL